MSHYYLSVSISTQSISKSVKEKGIYQLKNYQTYGCSVSEASTADEGRYNKGCYDFSIIVNAQEIALFSLNSQLEGG